MNSEIFVDKSEMIQYLNTVVKMKQKYVSVSRPRRFGKTMAADMICAYYDREADSRELFAGRKLAQCEPSRVSGRKLAWDTYLGQFDVIWLVKTRFLEKRRNGQPSKGDKRGRCFGAVLSVAAWIVLFQILAAIPGRQQFPNNFLRDGCHADSTGASI